MYILELRLELVVVDNIKASILYSDLQRMKHYRVAYSFIHSFIPDISIATLQVYHYSEALPTTARILTVSEFHAEAHRQLQVKDLPKVPTWRLDRESNPRPSR